MATQGSGRLAGEVAIVSGGARGIGEAVVHRFADEGAQVVLLDIDEDGAGRVAAACAEGARPPLALRCDITVEDDVGEAVAQATGRFDGVDVLVNNAGVNTYFDATAMTEAQWDQVFAVDLKGAWLCSKYVLPHMVDAGGGSIVNIASIHARVTIAGMFPYAAAKSALVGLTRSLALDYGDRNIRVNAVCPGWTRTQLVQEWFDLQPDPAKAERQVVDVHPLQRIAEPAEIAAFIAFVASDDASFVTGAELYVDGGLGARFAT